MTKNFKASDFSAEDSTQLQDAMRQAQDAIRADDYSE